MANQSRSAKIPQRNRLERAQADPIGVAMRKAASKLPKVELSAAELRSVATSRKARYDAAGNRTQKVSVAPPSQDDNGTTRYDWDGKNRLTQVTLPDSTVITYTYDYQNRLVSRTQGSEVRTFLFGSGNQVLEETLNGSRQALYGWGADGLASRTDATGQTLFYLKDGLGSVMAIIDEKANIVQSYEYSAFGECLSGKDGVNAFRFGGGYGVMTDDDTGLQYAWNRWRDPATGGWISEDPIRHEGGLNLYGYVENRPTTKTDATGLKEGYDPRKGYCGSGWNQPIVPEGPWAITNDFNFACYNHDRCYECCGVTKSGCDKKFLGEMTTMCGKYAYVTPVYLSCIEQAALYYGAVAIAGGDAFKKAQEASCCPKK